MLLVVGHPNTRQIRTYRWMIDSYLHDRWDELVSCYRVYRPKSQLLCLRGPMERQINVVSRFKMPKCHANNLYLIYIHTAKKKKKKNSTTCKYKITLAE